MSTGIFMSQNRWKFALRIISILVFFASLTWLIYQPGFEPLLGFLGALTGLLMTSEQDFDDIKYSRSRDSIIKKVRSFWINGILNKSLSNTSRINLRFELLPSLSPNGRVYVFPTHKNKILPLETKIIDLFNDSSGSLLIIGEPGSGKTTTALELIRDLLLLAEKEKTRPVPVFLNLSTWDRERKPISEWLIDELYSTYQLNKKFARKWIASEPFQIFLDGLDEVADKHRSSCVVEINKFVQEYNLTNIVICCRTLEYERNKVPLKINSVINILPLTSEQISDYFSKGSEQLVAAKIVVDADDTIKSFATTPLNLHIIGLAYGKGAVAPLNSDKPSEQRRQLFNTYIQQMLKSKGNNQYSEKRAVQWLSRLAQEMRKRSLSTFYFESIGISWMLSVKDKVLFYAILGIFSILIGGVFIIIFRLAVFVSNVGLYWAYGTLMVSFFLFPIFQDDSIKYVERISWSLVKMLNSMLISVTCGLIGVSIRAVIVPAIAADWRTHLLISMTYGVGGGLIWGMVSMFAEMQLGDSFRMFLKTIYDGYSDKRVKNTVLWLSEHATLSLVILMCTSLYYAKWFAELTSSVGGIIFCLCFGASSCGVLGIVFSEVEVRDQPGQGIYVSGQNAIKLILVSVISGIVGGVLSVWGLENKISSTSFISGVFLGISGGSYVGLVSGLVFGGAAFIQYKLLMALLSYNNYFPPDFFGFLEDMANINILRKVGGGYIFVHRWLFEHFLDEKIQI
jgi:eukaryotic-like serine/threonine-protein kinase